MSGSTLDQVMACCLMTPSHYLNQCWVIIKGVLYHLQKCSVVISQEVPINLICNMYSEITLLKLLPHLPRANGSQWICASRCFPPCVSSELIFHKLTPQKCFPAALYPIKCIHMIIFPYSSNVAVHVQIEILFPRCLFLSKNTLYHCCITHPCRVMHIC